MVEGLALFAEHFSSLRDQYILIGGAACDVLHEEAGLPFRATKDLDIVLCVESLDSRFPTALWDFIRRGDYEILERSNGRPVFYRFSSPRVEGYPAQLELFSRKPEELQLSEDAHIAPISPDSTAASMSAILLDDAYYGILKEGRIEVSGIPTVRSEYLILLKAKAFLDLTARKAKGEEVKGDDIKKHKRDVFRLYRLVEPYLSLPIPGSIQADMREFLKVMETEEIDLKSLGIEGQDKASILNTLAKFYRITDWKPASQEGATAV